MYNEQGKKEYQVTTKPYFDYQPPILTEQLNLEHC